MQIKKHMSCNIQGLLSNYKRKKITFIEDDDGKPMTDQEARLALHKLIGLGHKLISTSNECEGFDPFGGGCPGHEIKE